MAGGRPPGPSKKIQDIPASLVEGYASLLPMSEEAIAEQLGISHKSLRTHFADAIQKGRSNGKKLLASWQFESAKKGSAVMQIWLGKNYLGQLDKPAEKDDDTEKGVITLKYKL